MPETDLALIEQRIYTIRGVRVILDSDLAALYGVPTKRLNEHFEVANCDLKFTRWSPIPPICLHRIWCVDGELRLEKFWLLFPPTGAIISP